ncbi:hypothetical protein BKA70DRAFT_1532170 [Coprinopsis sp. MPI-PUGE-AT-0042]|nr:hypothetical protein BKA70DRAFT_1532170 [Coprinopsis sp. MPI-PUGE-AT-0042]
MLEGPSPEEALPAVIIFLVVMLPGIVIQLVMCLYALRTFQQKPTGRHDGKRRRLLSLIFAIIIIYSAAVSIELWNIVCRMLGRNAYPPWSLGVNIALTMAYMCVGDCLMLWRCWVIWNGQRWVVLFPILLFLTYFAFGIITIIDSVTRQPPLAGVLSVTFSVATNVTITSLIVYKLLVARREVIKSEMYDYAPRFYRDLVVILVESAAPLALAGVCAVAVSAARISNDRHDQSVPGLYLSVLASNLLFLLFSALSPQMILFRTLVTQGGQAESDAGATRMFTTRSAHLSTVQNLVS